MSDGYLSATEQPPEIVLPGWSRVTDKRRAHIARVTALLDHWANALGLGPDDRAAWHDVGVLHDALRDADEAELRALTGDTHRPMHILHGPAVAATTISIGKSSSRTMRRISAAC